MAAASQGGLSVGRQITPELPVTRGGHLLRARVWPLAAYKDFFALWKDADPHIPILKEAKVEYAKLQ